MLLTHFIQLDAPPVLLSSKIVYRAKHSSMYRPPFLARMAHEFHPVMPDALRMDGQPHPRWCRAERRVDTSSRCLKDRTAPEQVSPLGGRIFAHLHGLRYNLHPFNFRSYRDLANTLSAQQRTRNSARKAVFNRLHRSRSRTFIANTRELIADKNLDGAKVEIIKAMSALDKAAGKGVIHKNNAARRKSRLMKALNKAELKK